MQQDQELFTDDIPLACTLSASELVTREQEVNDLFKHVQQVNELADGYALRFPGNDTWANQLTQFITFERGCCPFFTFSLLFRAEARTHLAAFAWARGRQSHHRGDASVILNLTLVCAAC